MKGFRKFPKLPTDSRVEMFLTKSKGLGVRATKSIRKGDVIEVCPVILMRNVSLDSNRLTWQLSVFAFYWEPRGCAIVLGLGSLYNHDPYPNCMWYMSEVHKRPVVISVAVRSIKLGEELTHDYNAGYGEVSNKGAEFELLPLKTLEKLR